MKVLKELRIKTKDELYQTINDKKVLPLFHIYQKMIKYNIINIYIYLIICFIEYIMMFYELLYDGTDFVHENKSTPSQYFFFALQYANFSSFINKIYLKRINLLIITCAVYFIVFANIIFLLIFDLLNKKAKNANKHKFKAVYIICGVYNVINMKILIIPMHYILCQSFKIGSYDENQNDLIFNDNTNIFDEIFIRILSILAFLVNYYTLYKTCFLYNDINPLKNKIAFSCSDPGPNLISANVKIIFVICNVIKGRLLFAKKFSSFAFFAIILYIRKNEWFYYCKLNKIASIMLDYSFAFFSFLTLCVDVKANFAFLLTYIFASLIFGVISYCVISHLSDKIIKRKISDFSSESDFCELIMYIIFKIKNLQNDTKGKSDEIFFGFLTSHSKSCNNPHCTSKTISNLLYENESKFSNEIDTFTLSKSEFCSYCKTDKNDNFEILQDATKNHCDKIIYYIIKCIVDSAIKTLPRNKIKFLPLIIAYVYIHIFNNNFYAMFQIMTYYECNSAYNIKFFFFSAMSTITELMTEENNSKFTSQTSLICVTDYYFYYEKFINAFRAMLMMSQELFDKLNYMQPTSNEILRLSAKLGVEIKELHRNYQTMMSLNPYEVNVLRIYTFAIDKLYNMKSMAKANTVRLLQNIKYFLMNDKYKATNFTSNGNAMKDGDIKLTVKNFHENSDSCVIILSGLLDNIGEVLYCNDVFKAVFGYERNEIVGSNISIVIPQPIGNVHNEIVLNFYKTGIRYGIDRVRNRFGLHKNGTIINTNYYVLFLPNLEHGIMFIGFVKCVYSFKLSYSKYNAENYDKRDNNNNAKFDKKSSIMSKKENNNKDFNKKNSIIQTEKETARSIVLPAIDNVVFKVSDTGVLILNSAFDILHMNIFALVNFFGCIKPFPPKKINMRKVCKEFAASLQILLTGETVTMIFDAESIANKIYENNNNANNNYNGTCINSTLINANNNNGSFCSFYLEEREYPTNNNNNNVASPRISSNSRNKERRSMLIKNRNVKITLIRNSYYTKEQTIDYYYIVALQTISQKDTSMLSQEDEFNYDEDNDNDNNASSDDNITITNNNNNEQNQSPQTKIIKKKKTRKEKNILDEKTKKKLLNDTYISNFTRAANISLYILVLIILIWLCISHVIELNKLKTIRETLRSYSANEKLINVISNYLLEAYLLIRINLCPLSNSRQIFPILNTAIRLEQESLYDLIRYNYRMNKDGKLNNAIMKFKTKSENGTISFLEITIDVAIEKLMFNTQYIKNANNYIGASFTDFFDETKPSQLKSKMYFIFDNYYDVFYENVGEYSSQIVKELHGDIANEKKMLSIIFAGSYALCIIIAFLFVVSLLSQEQKKKDFLNFLCEIKDEIYIEKIELFNTFAKNFEILLVEDHNIHKIKNLLDKDDDFKSEFVSCDNFINRNSNDIFSDIYHKHREKQSKTNSTTLSALSKRNSSSINVLRKSVILAKPNRSSDECTKLLPKQKSKFSFSEFHYSTLKTAKDNSLINDESESETSITEVASMNNERELLNEHMHPSSQIEEKETKSYIRRFNKQKTSIPKLSKHELLSVLSPSTNPNLILRKSITQLSKPSHHEIFASKNSFAKEKETLCELSESESSESIQMRNFAIYPIPYKKTILIFVFAFIYLSSFFTVSLVFLFVYYDKMSTIVEVSALLFNRDKQITNLLITQNLNLMNNFTFSLKDKYNIETLTSQIQQIENDYKAILMMINSKSNTYKKILIYENENLCEQFAKFNTTYNIIECEVLVKGNGISFKISEIVQYIYEMYLVVNHKRKNGEGTVQLLEENFNDPIFINLIVENVFFLRLFMGDINNEYVKDYSNYFHFVRTVLHTKFAVYFALVAGGVAIYLKCLLPRIIEIINNLTRVKLIF